MKIEELRGLIATAALVFVAMPASSDPQAFEVRRGLEYADRGSVKLVGDLYVPRDAGPHPALIAVYDGARSHGEVEDWASFLTQRGYVILALEHRLIRTADERYPVALHDVRAAERFLRSHSNPTTVGVVADSAATHLSALVEVARTRALEDDDPSFGTGKKWRVCGEQGVYDLFVAWPEFEPT